jgi:hypothetical protein
VNVTTVDSSTTDRVRQILSRILELATFSGSHELRAQIPLVKVTGGPVTLLDLTVEGGSPASAKDGPIPVRAIVGSRSDDPAGELLVWVEGGHFSGLEFAWFTDDQPQSLPAPEDIRVECTQA